MTDYNPLFNSRNNISQISSIRDSLRFTPIKPTKLINEDDYYNYNHNSSNHRDIDHDRRPIHFMNNIINLESNNLSSLSHSLRQKERKIEDQINRSEGKCNCARSRKKSTDSRHQFLSKPQSAVDKLSSSSSSSSPLKSKLINKHELSYIKESIYSIKEKINKLVIEKEQNANRLKEFAIELNKIKQRKKEVEAQIENKISQRESFEEIYRGNISKYLNQNSNSNHHYHCFNQASSALLDISGCYSDNIIISKEEVSELSTAQCKEVIVTILNDLFDSKTELIYYNLIEAVISKTYADINLLSGFNDIRVFFAKLSKGICDIYPIINSNAFNILLKYAVKQHYIDNIIERDMHFLSKEYKSKKRECKGKIKEIKETIPKCESQLSEAKEKEKELLKQLESIAPSGNSIRFNKDTGKKNHFEYNYEFHTVDEQSFCNKTNIATNNRYSNNNDSKSSNLLISLVSEKKKGEIQNETNMLLSNRESNENTKNTNNKIEEYNDPNDTIILQLNNNNNNNINESKSTFHHSASNTGSAFMKNELSSLSWILDDKTNQFQMSKSPPKMGRNSKSNNSNHFNCSSILKKYPDYNSNSNSNCDYIFKQRSSPIKQIDNSNQNFTRIAKVLSNSKFNKSDRTQNSNVANSKNQSNSGSTTSNKHLMRSSSSISIQPKQNLQSSYLPLLNSNTYCYYKLLSKYDPKYNPLLSQSSSPEKLGYDKGFISFSPINFQITISPSNDTTDSQQRVINVSEIKNTIVLNLIKDISCLHRSYQRMLQISQKTTININDFIQREEFRHISMSDNDKIKSVLCSFFSFSLSLKDCTIVEFIFVSYNEFKSWLNGLGNMLNSD